MEGIEEQYKKNREAVVDKLLERVVRVKMELHKNAIKAE